MDTYNDIARPVRRIGAVENHMLKDLYAWQISNKIHDLTKKPADGIAKYKEILNGKNAFGLNIELGSSRYSDSTEILSHENVGSKIEAGTDLSLRAREKDISMTGGTLQGKNVTLEAKKNIDLRAAENTTHTVTESRSSSSGISASYSFGTGTITDVGIHADRSSSTGIGERTTYTPAIVQAKEKLSMTAGADTNIIGSQASGKKVDMKVGGNLNIESLQEKDDYREKNSSSGFSISASVTGGKINAKDPDIGASYSKGKIDSRWKSVTGQAGIYAGTDGFHIHVEKNTDLKGAVIASEASPEKNKLTTGTLTFSDLENTASYKVSDKGVSFHVGGNVKPGDKGLLPATHMPIHGSASSVTKSAVSSGAIEILRRPIQDLAGLSRNTDNAQKPLEKIFDKDKILEQQEAAELFGELANRAVGDIAERMHWKEGDPRKIFLKSLTAGIMNRIAGGSFGKGMTAGAVNELLIARLLSWQDAYGHPIIPTELLQGISYGAGMAIDGTEGAVIAQSGTKHNIFEHLEDFLDEQEREAFLKAVEACGGDEYEVAQVFEQGGYLQRALSRIGKTPTPGYEYKPIIYTKADGTKFVRIVEVEKNASTKTPDEDGFTKTNIIDDKNSSHTEERIYWGPWRRTTQIAEKPKADTENTNSNDGNATMPIQKGEANNKDILGKNQRDSTTERKNTPTKDTSSPSWKENKKDHQDENNGQGNQMRGADVKRRGSDQRSKKDNRDRIDHSIEKQRETSGKNRTDKTENLKNNSKTENTDSNREKRVEWGKTTAIETFKFMGDLPVSLLNEQASSIIKEYKSVQKEVPAYVLKQGRLTKVGVLSPLGLIYDTYQDAQKYNGGKFVGAVAINTGAFVGTILLDSALTSTGVGAIGVIVTNVFVAEGTTWLKEKVLDEPKVEEKH
ncbi:hemagglutinin repeat-containing protein [Selenomonas noxia]|uniref:hemagglutinin repeat-containing protein n=1 Tax=Selenomonas noxia TaxID=135083 RepID=UPI00248BB77D|nr:hemagglutinin repeat-containing protein [Selenomonas noxia]